MQLILIVVSNPAFLNMIFLLNPVLHILITNIRVNTSIISGGNFIFVRASTHSYGSVVSYIKTCLHLSSSSLPVFPLTIFYLSAALSSGIILKTSHPVSVSNVVCFLNFHLAVLRYYTFCNLLKFCC